MLSSTYAFVPLTHWLTVLNQLLPPKQLCVLGAGNGTSSLLNWANQQSLQNLTLIEASDVTFLRLCEQWKPRQPSWEFCHAIVENGQPADTFYTVNIPSENGLLAPEQLCSLWPNLNERARRGCQPQAMSALVNCSGSTDGYWLVIDYLCSPNVMAFPLCDTVDVLQIRVSSAESLPSDMQATNWERELKSWGFNIVHREAERHPDIEQWLCVRSFENTDKCIKSKLAIVYSGGEDCQQAQRNWCQGDWQALIMLDNATLSDHPQRIMLGIYAACGHQQIGEEKAEQRCVDAVRKWGAPTDLIKRFLLSGVYNRLGRANALLGEYDAAFSYFCRSLDNVANDIVDAKGYLAQRIASQLTDIPEEDLNAVLKRLNDDHC